MIFWMILKDGQARMNTLFDSKKKATEYAHRILQDWELCHVAQVRIEVGHKVVLAKKPVI